MFGHHHPHHPDDRPPFDDRPHFGEHHPHHPEDRPPMHRGHEGHPPMHDDMRGGRPPR